MPSLAVAPVVRALFATAIAMAASLAMAVPMGESDARHLLARTGFGPTTAEVRTYAALSRDDAVAKLLGDVRTAPATPPPPWIDEFAQSRRPGPMASAEERKAFQQMETRRAAELRGWWIREMLVTPSPLTERMTLFWHNHFVSSQQKVRDARLIYVQNETLRAQALGNFAGLLHAVAPVAM